MVWKLYISEQAGREIDEIWEYGFDKFGLQIADDYDALIQQALVDIKEDPYCIGVKKIRGFREEMYSYHLMHCNKHAEGNIKSPSHAVFYFITNEQTIAVVSISREIRERHIASLSRDSVVSEISKKNEKKTKF